MELFYRIVAMYRKRQKFKQEKIKVLQSIEFHANAGKTFVVLLHLY